MAQKEQHSPRESEEKFAKAFRCSPEPFTLSTLKEDRYIEVNDAFEFKSGYRREEVIGRTGAELGIWVDWAERGKLVEKLLRGEPVRNIEFRFRNRTGELFIFLLSAELLELAGEMCVVANAIDITGWKRTEEALRESEERLRFAVQAGTMFAYSWDAATDVIERSGESAGILGVKNDQAATGAAVLAMVHPDDQERLAAALTKLTVENPTLQITYRIIRPDGLVKWLERSSRAYFDADRKLERIIGVIADVTERKLGEEALRESEEKFRSVFRNAGVGMAIVSPEGRFLAANGTFCDSLGYTEEELLSKTVESVTFPEDWPDFSQKLGEAITEGIGLWRFEKRCLHKSGHIVYTETSASLMRNRNGEPQYFVAAVLDVTKRKEAEEKLSGMTRKLVEAQEKERTRIARELHDDINQRLAMLAVQLEQLEKTPSEVQSHLHDLRKRMVELSNDVQALSHELHSSKLEYLGVVEGIKSWCKESGKRQKIEIDFRSDVSTTLSFDIGLCLLRVLQEAVRNAVKHGGAKHIEVRLRENSGEIHLIIRDSGTGFDVEAASQGKGLGLTSMHERVRLVNGTIAIDSKPMIGTTIRVRVPLESEQGARREAV